MITSLKHRTYIYLPKRCHNRTHDSKAWMFGLRQCDMAAELGRRPHPEDSMWLPKSLSRARFTAKILWNGWKLHVKLLDMLDIVVCFVFLGWSFFVLVGPFQSTSISLVKTCPSLHPANPLPFVNGYPLLPGEFDLAEVGNCNTDAQLDWAGAKGT